MQTGESTIGSMKSVSTSRRSGFTIVELLIVIVVIAILATISIVAYNGIQQRAATTVILSEVKQWRNLFEVYKAANGSYPAPATGDPLTSGGPGSNMLNAYCLGTGFPQSNGTSYCYVVNSSSTYAVAEATGSYILSQLTSVGRPPLQSKKYVYGTVTGPVLKYVSASNVQMFTIFPGGTSCSDAGMLNAYGDANRQDCYYKLDYSN